jgi:hypothetical protein
LENQGVKHQEKLRGFGEADKIGEGKLWEEQVGCLAGRGEMTEFD